MDYKTLRLYRYHTAHTDSSVIKFELDYQYIKKKEYSNRPLN